MSWTNINMADVKTDLDIIPAGMYTFELLPGSKYSDVQPNKIEASATIVNGGEFTGRKMFFSYPDPKQFEWSPKVLKRFMNALGVDPLFEEDPVQTLNRAAHSRFMAPVRHREQENVETGTKITRANLDIFNVKCAA